MDELSKTQAAAWQKAVNKFLLSEEAAKYMGWGDLTPTQIADTLDIQLGRVLKDNDPYPISKALELGNASLTDQTAAAFDQVQVRFAKLSTDEQLMLLDLCKAMGNAHPQHAEFISRVMQASFLSYRNDGVTPFNRIRANAEHAVQARYEFFLKELALVNNQFDPKDNVVPLKAATEPDYSQQKLTTWLLSWMAEMDGAKRSEIAKTILQYAGRSSQQATNNNLTADLRQAIHTHHGKVNLLAPCMKVFGQLALERLAGILQLFFKEARDELSQDPPLITLFNSACADEALANVNEWRRVCVANGQLIEEEARVNRDTLLQALQLSSGDFNLVIHNLADQLGTSTIEYFEPTMREAMLEALSQPMVLDTNTCIHFLVARVKEKLQLQENSVETPETQTPESTELTLQQLINDFNLPPTLLPATAAQLVSSPLNQRIGWEKDDVMESLIDLYRKDFQRYLENLENVSDDHQPRQPFTDGVHMKMAAKCADQLFQELRKEWFHAWNQGQFETPIGLHEILAAGEVNPLTYTEIIDAYKHGENGKRLLNAHGLETFNEMLEIEMISVLRIDQYRGERLVHFATNRLDLHSAGQGRVVSSDMYRVTELRKHLESWGISEEQMYVLLGQFAENHGGLNPNIRGQLRDSLKAALLNYDQIPDQTTFEELVNNILEQALVEAVAHKDVEPYRLRTSAELQGEPRGAEPLLEQHHLSSLPGPEVGLFHLHQPSVDDLVEEMLKETEEITIEAIMYQLPKQVQVGDILKATNGALRFKQADTVKVIRKIVKACAERLVDEQ